MLSVTSPPPAVDDDAMTVRILDAAYDRMLQFGLRRTTVEDVARQAGVARITIYRRFPNREELVRAVVLREAARIFGQVDAAVEGLESLEDQLVEGFVAVLREVRTHPLVIRLLATEIDLLLPVVTVEGGPVVAVARQYLAGHLRRAQTAGRMRRSDPEAVAELLVRLTLSFLVTPDSCIPLDTDPQARAFARRFLVPLSQLSFPAER
jgi:AcrR family transcriptional regulator